MKTFAERLKIALSKKQLSQTEAAKICGIAQQSLNYIILNNLTSSKLAPKIASALNINPEWLIWGQGRLEETKIYEIPILHSKNMINKFLHHKIDYNNLEFTTIDVYLGEMPFAYLYKPNKLAICSSNEIKSFIAKEYLFFSDDGATLCQTNQSSSFPIFEWRLRSSDF